MLSDDLKVLLASSYSYQLKAHYFHWNVEGSDFAQLHEFFGQLYQEVFNSIDMAAEVIRQLDEYAPGSFDRFRSLSIVDGQVKVPRARLMLEELLEDTNKMVDLTKRIFKVAVEENQEGIADFIAGRIDAFAKHAWMLRSFLKARD
ncbi:MAG: DNA starvation/stationary phase protection protein [Euryarchaeota archaeon]|nr:DNA starvation/stationary phase protection protein [Euryarchaeota archaeon]